MNNLLKLSLLLTLSIFVFSCSNNDDTPPPPVNEEEIITTLVVTLQPVGGGTNITLTSRDLDGDGPNDPVITISDNLDADTDYNGAVAFLNETESPAEDITEEVNEESEEHQVFFITSGSLDAEFTYLNFDMLVRNWPIGIEPLESYFITSFVDRYGVYPICNNKSGYD